MKNPSDFDPQLRWLAELAASMDLLQRTDQPLPYWSQRRAATQMSSRASWAASVRMVRQLIQDLYDQHLFAETLGFECVDGSGDYGSSPGDELERRVGKPGLWTADTSEWDEDDLCDFVEVFHDLAARPTNGWQHAFNGCGWHPSSFNRKSGQALYRWRINEVLETGVLDVRLADGGEDIGRMVRVAPGELSRLVEETLHEPAPDRDEVTHAVALFRHRAGSRSERRSAIAALARVLESRRALLKAELLTKDEDALFTVANRFDIRHHNTDQQADYRDEFLDWIFFWYLATIQLSDRIIAGPQNVGPTI